MLMSRALFNCFTTHRYLKCFGVSARDAVKLPTMHRTLLPAPQQRVIWSKMSVVVEKTCSIPSLVLDVGNFYSPMSAQMPGVAFQAKK